jgi:hypothetical protein
LKYLNGDGTVEAVDEFENTISKIRVVLVAF